MRWGWSEPGGDATDGWPLLRRWRRRGEVSALPTLSGQVSALTVFDDDATGHPCAVACSAGGDVAIVDLVTGRAVGAVMRVGPWINAVAVVRLSERQAVVVAEAQGALRVLDPTTAEERSPAMRSDGRGTRRLWAMACVEWRGRPTAIVGSSTAELELWDLTSGGWAGTLSTAVPYWGVTQVVASPIGDAVAVATGLTTGEVAVWRGIDGKAGMSLELVQRRTPVEPGRVDALAIGDVDGRPVLLYSSGRHAQALDLWSLESLGKPFTAHSGDVTSLMTGAVAGRRVALSGDEDGTLLAWDPETGVQVGGPHPAPIEHARLSVAAEVGGRTILLTGTRASRLVRWELGAPAAPADPAPADVWWPLQHPSRVAVTELDGRPVAVGGFSDGAVRLFDLADGAGVRGPLAVGNRDVRGIAVTTVAGRRLVASGEAALVVHDLDTGEPVAAPLAIDVHALAAAEVDGRPVLVVGRGSGELVLLDAGSLESLGEPMTGHRGRVWMIATAEVAGRSLALSASEDGCVALWDLRTGQPVHRRLVVHPGGAYAVTAGVVAGRAVAFSGGLNGQVMRVDLEEALRDRPWPLGRRATPTPVMDAHLPVTALALATAGARAMLAVGVSSRADDGTGTQVHWVDPEAGRLVQSIPLIGIVDSLAASGGLLVIGAEEGLLAYEAAEPPIGPATRSRAAPAGPR